MGLGKLSINGAEKRLKSLRILTVRRISSFQEEFFKQVEKFLNYTDQQILQHAGRISHSMAIAKASEEYEKYRVHQNHEYLSDFDRALVKYLKGSDES